MMHTITRLGLALALVWLTSEEALPQLWKVNPEACPEACAKDAEKWLKKVEKSEISGEQRMFLRKAVESDPSCVEAQFLLAKKTWLAERFDESLQAFEAVAQLCPEYSPYTYFYMGKIKYKLGLVPEAVAAWEKFLTFEDVSDASYDEVKRYLPLWKKESDLKKHPVPFAPKAVADICTEKDEYSASLAPDNKYIYFTRKELRKPRGGIAGSSAEPIGVEIFYRSKKKANGDWELGEEMPRPFNMEHTNGAASVTADNKIMYFVVCTNNAAEACDIWTSYWDKYRWAPLRNLGGVVNSSTWDSQPTVSYDGNTMIFASARGGGLGGTDLYISTRDELGRWGKPENLGPVINSEQNELTPFLHSDSQTLYFSSKGHKGLGGYDIFYTKRNSDGSWQEPTNIGYPINTEGDEVSFFVSLDGETGFFSTNQLSLPNGTRLGKGGLDLFSFALHPAARPEKVMLIKGALEDPEGNALGGIIEVKNETTQEITRLQADSTDGSFVAIVAANSEHRVTVQSEGLAYASTTIKPKEKTAETQVKLSSGPIKEGAAYRLQDIVFATNSSELNQAAIKNIQGFGEWLAKKPKLRVGIHGHTDNVGQAAQNQELSQARADAVKAYLLSMGIDEQRLESKGFGQSEPVADNATEEGRAKNRRTEFVILAD